MTSTLSSRKSRCNSRINRFERLSLRQVSINDDKRKCLARHELFFDLNLTETLIDGSGLV